MGSIERVDRPKPWRARYRTPDGRRVSQSFRRKADAEKWLLLEEGDVLAGRWHDPRSGTELFSDYCEKWMEQRSPTVARKTDYNTEAALRGRIMPVFGSKRLKQITTKGIREWLSSLLAEGLSPATVRSYRQIFGQVLNQAVADGLLVSNPVDGVKAPSVRPRRQMFLTADELRMLAKATGDYEPLIWFLGWSGLRFGEAAALRVGRVDARRRRVRVEESVTEVGGRLVFGPPKTHESRTVILPQFVMAGIAPILEGRERDALVFTAVQGGPLRLNVFRKRVFAPAGSIRPRGPEHFPSSIPASHKFPLYGWDAGSLPGPELGMRPTKTPL